MSDTPPKSSHLQTGLFLALYAAGFCAILVPAMQYTQRLPDVLHPFIPPLQAFVPDFLRADGPPSAKANLSSQQVEPDDIHKPFTFGVDRPFPPPYLLNADSALAAFKTKMVRLKKGLTDRVRILHFGDSALWNENTARQLRTRLQNTYGQGGRGFVYLHSGDIGIKLDGHRGQSSGFADHFLPYELFNHNSDKTLKHTGFLGMTYRSWPTGISRQQSLQEAVEWDRITAIVRPELGAAYTQTMTVQSGPTVSGDDKFKVTAQVPLGLQAEAAVGTGAGAGAGVGAGTSVGASPKPGQPCKKISATFPPSKDVIIRLPPPKGQGQSAYIDAVMLESAQGVSYSSIILKGRHKGWLTAVREKNFTCGFQALAPDLIIFQFGINESASIDWKSKGYSAQAYLKQAGELFSRLQKALPNTGILLIGPLERLKKKNGIWSTYSAHIQMRQMQRELAFKHNLAFFDTWSFLGGPGHMQDMVAKKLAQYDRTHLSLAGGDVIADGVYTELQAFLEPSTGLKAAGLATNLDGPGQVHIATPDKADSAATPGKLDKIGKQDKPGKLDKQIKLDNLPAKGANKSAGRPSPGSTIPTGLAGGGTASPIIFNSSAYLYFFVGVFFIATLLFYFPVGRLIFLTAASWFFYASWKWWVISLILGSTLLDYIVGRQVERSRMKNKRGTLWLVTSLVGNLGLLFFFKYHDFFAGLVNPYLMEWLGTGPAAVPILNLLLPVGISFYTFQSLSYTIDVYRGKLRAETNFFRFSLYVAFFPQLVAGPIVRAVQFLPQMTDRICHFVLNRRYAALALFLIATGLLKKALADMVAVTWVDSVFASPEMFTAAESVAAIYGFAVQIYLDFSSYTDIALGSAALLGFQLPPNFNEPYKAITITDFWRRWHISLGAWLRDYLYISLGGNKRRVYFNLGITMLLGGLWHGAGINFVLWGLFHGFFLIVERLLGLHRLERSALPLWSLLPLQLLVFHIVLAGWVLFRCEQWPVFSTLMDSLGTGIWSAPNLEPAVMAALAVPMLWHWAPTTWKAALVDGFVKLPAAFQGAGGALFSMAAYRLSLSEARAFIYFQF